MSTVINTNVRALNSQRSLKVVSESASKASEKLSSGLRINRAGDDAAGLAISEKMRNQIKGLNQASRNAQDGISLIQTAEGALQETHDMLQRMRELLDQAANDTNMSSDRNKIATELGLLIDEIDATAEKTEFNTKKLIDGSLASANVKLKKGLARYTFTKVTYMVSNINGHKFSQGVAHVGGTKVVQYSAVKGSYKIVNNGVAFSGKVYLQVGANDNQAIEFTIEAMHASSLGVTRASMRLASFTSLTGREISNLIKKIDFAVEKVSTQRANLGATQNRLEHTIKNLDTSSENLQAAESRIRDTDMAKEMMNFTKSNVLQQAATTMLAQANQAPNQVLSLLG